jgi:hypothetical protein
MFFVYYPMLRSVAQDFAILRNRTNQKNSYDSLAELFPT